MQELDLGDGLSLTLVFDGESARVIGNLMGAYWIPPRGGREYWCVNGTCGGEYGMTDKEARDIILAEYTR